MKTQKIMIRITKKGFLSVRIDGQSIDACINKNVEGDTFISFNSLPYIPVLPLSDFQWKEYLSDKKFTED